jgi:CheY-like chemotaxis protein
MPSPTILIVEDDEGDREALRELLLDEGYSVDEATDGRDAIQHLVSPKSADQPSLILLDLHMEPMNGWELLSVLRSYTRLARIPVVLVSGCEPSFDVVGQGTVSAFVQKPFSNINLMSIVRKFTQPELTPSPV